MAYMRMSLENVIFMTLISVSGITNTVGSHAALAAHGLADVAHTSQFEMEILSSYPAWYREGMRLSAYKKTSCYWDKTDINWALTRKSTVLTESEVITAMTQACAKWAAVTPLKFHRVFTSDEADIRVQFVNMDEADTDTTVHHVKSQDRKDTHGVTIQWRNNPKWRGRNTNGRHNIKFYALYEMGHALGLGDSEYSDAIMAGLENPISTSPDDPELTKDDIDGMQKKYGGPPGSGIEKETMGFLERRRQGKWVWGDQYI